MTASTLESKPRALRPRARIMRTLGNELISNESVAVLELVKNAYDADASYVCVRFESSLRKGEGSICIQDDGHGMTLDVVETSWMEPATNHKKKTKRSKYLDRRLLGEKGVGRFAASRLADELELITRSVGSDKEIYAFFDWSQFDNDDAYLDEILILTEERKPLNIISTQAHPVVESSEIENLPRDGNHGTLLRMNRLKRTWEQEDIEKLRRNLCRLISPFENDKEFRIFLQSIGETESTPQELHPPEIIKYPHYTLSGELKANGECCFTIILHASGVTKKLNSQLVRSGSGGRDLMEISNGNRPEDAIDLTCGPISFNILVWDRDQLDNIDQKLGIGIRDIRKDLDSVAGISIFRNSFRVLPYGEPENDWLKLDIRRIQNPTLRLSNNQITGYITISADDNPLLKDQSNREGLDNNQAYADLQATIKLALSKLENLRFQEKSHKNKDTSEKKKTSTLLETPDTSILRERLSRPGSDQETLQLFDATTKAWEEQIVRIRTVLSRYHTLATLGQLVDKVIHDGRQPLSTIQTQSSLALESVIRSINKVDVTSESHKQLSTIEKRLLRVKDAAGLIDLLLKRIEPLGGRRRGHPSKVYLNEIIKNSFAHFQQDLENLAVKVSLPSNDDLVQVDALELQEVLINLISNSLYWLSQTPKDRRAIVVQCTRPLPNEVDIIFADSGPGIPHSNRSTIFEPYFTTKPDGVGLGLVIAGEVIKDYYNGSLELLNSGPLSGAAFRIKLRKRV